MFVSEKKSTVTILALAAKDADARDSRGPKVQISKKTSHEDPMTPLLGTFQ